MHGVIEMLTSILCFIVAVMIFILAYETSATKRCCNECALCCVNNREAGSVSAVVKHVQWLYSKQPCLYYVSTP